MSLSFFVIFAAARNRNHAATTPSSEALEPLTRSGCRTGLLVIPAAVPSIHLGVDGATLAAGPSLGATSLVILLAAGGDDPPPLKGHDDPPPHG
jgi:hypothetical protein